MKDAALVRQGEPAAPEKETTEHSRRKAAASESDVPPGWTYNPSAWTQRIPILALALLNAALAGYLALCELGLVRHAWDPFFGGGTDRVLHSSISRMFPVPDAVLGAGAYLLEAISTVLGGTRRWRTKPWLVLVFAILVLPLCIVSLVLLVLQPLVVHAWCTFCLIAAAAMLFLVALALDEPVAAVQTLVRSVHAEEPIWKALWKGDAPEGAQAAPVDADARTAAFQGFTIPWNLAVCIALGGWLIVAPSVFHTEGGAAINDFIVGALLVSFGLLACAEPARALRFVCTLCGLWLLVIAPWSFTATSAAARPNAVIVGIAVLVCSALRGRVKERYDGWDRFIV